MLEFSKGEGDTPMHSTVWRNADALLRIMLECRHDLLFRENASGRTPFEMAEDTYLANDVSSYPLSGSDHSH